MCLSWAMGWMEDSGRQKTHGVKPNTEAKVWTFFNFLASCLNSIPTQNNRVPESAKNTQSVNRNILTGIEWSPLVVHHKMILKICLIWNISVYFKIKIVPECRYLVIHQQTNNPSKTKVICWNGQKNHFPFLPLLLLLVSKWRTRLVEPN